MVARCSAEVFWIKAHLVLGEIAAPTLIVHGTKDTFVPVDSSRAAVSQFQVEHKLVEIEGAQHGFAVPHQPARDERKRVRRVSEQNEDGRRHCAGGTRQP